jgi:hypothetical protein
VRAGAPEDEIKGAIQAVFDAVAKAATHAPPSELPIEAIEAGVVADMLNRAATEYLADRKQGSPTAYLGGYGFLLAAKARSDAVLAYLGKANPDAASAMEEALKELAAAYPSNKRPEIDAVEPGPVLAAVAKFKLALTAK